MGAGSAGGVRLFIAMEKIMSRTLQIAEQAFFMLYSMAPLLADGDTPKEEIEDAIKKGARSGVRKARAFKDSTSTKADDEVYRLMALGINEADDEIENPTEPPADDDSGETQPQE